MFSLTKKKWSTSNKFKPIKFVIIIPTPFVIFFFKKKYIFRPILFYCNGVFFFNVLLILLSTLNGYIFSHAIFFISLLIASL